MPVLNAVLVAWSLLPLAGMLAALGYAVWLRQEPVEATAARRRQPLRRPDAD